MSVTAVPLQPVSKSGVWTLGLGLLLLLAIGIGGAWWTTRGFGDVAVETLAKGTGASPKADDFVLINYVGKLEDGTEFDRAEQAPMDLGSVVPGFGQGLTQMQKGGKYRITIPSRLGYGAEEKKNPQTGEVVIPANSDLVFDIELVDFKPRAEVEAIQRQMQMMQQQMGGGLPGGPGGPGGAPNAPLPQPAPIPPAQ